MIIYLQHGEEGVWAGQEQAQGPIKEASLVEEALPVVWMSKE